MISILGIIQAFDEVDVIADTISYLRPAVDDLIVFDHGSTDGTKDLISPSMLRSIPRSGIDKVFPFISKFIAEQKHDWVIWQAADETLRGPLDQPLIHATLEAEVALGTQVIDPLVRNFWPCTIDPSDPKMPFYERLRYFIEGDRLLPTPRAWLRSLTGIMPLGSHRAPHGKKCPIPRLPPSIGNWPAGTSIDQSWFLHHYPLRSETQAASKLKRRHTAGRPFYARFREGYPPKFHWNPYYPHELTRWRNFMREEEVDEI